MTAEQSGLVARSRENTPPAYVDFKVIDHIPLAVFVLLIADADEVTSSGDTRSRVSHYIDSLGAMAPSISADRFPDPGSLERERSVQRDSLALLRRTLEASRIDKEELLGFARSQRADIEANFAGAAAAQLRALDQTIRPWRREWLTPERWNSIRVVILGASTAHRRELHLQYFSAVMGVPMETVRIA